VTRYKRIFGTEQIFSQGVAHEIAGIPSDLKHVGVWADVVHDLTRCGGSSKWGSDSSTVETEFGDQGTAASDTCTLHHDTTNLKVKYLILGSYSYSYSSACIYVYLFEYDFSQRVRLVQYDRVRL